MPAAHGQPSNKAQELAVGQASAMLFPLCLQPPWMSAGTAGSLAPHTCLGGVALRDGEERR